MRASRRLQGECREDRMKWGCEGIARSEMWGLTRSHIRVSVNLSVLHLAKTTGVKISKRLMDLLLSIHHKWTMSDDRLVDRFAAEQQHPGVVAGLQGQLRAVALKQCQLPLARNFFAIDQHRTAQDHQRGIASGVQAQGQRLAGVEAQVPHVDGREGVCWAFCARELTGNQA